MFGTELSGMTVGNPSCACPRPLGNALVCVRTDLFLEDYRPAIQHRAFSQEMISGQTCAYA
jgi:hypothetical protein